MVYWCRKVTWYLPSPLLELWTRYGPVISLCILPQIEWLNKYHATCLQVVGDYLKEKDKMDVLQWLQRETEPIQQ